MYTSFSRLLPCTLAVFVSSFGLDVLGDDLSTIVYIKKNEEIATGFGHVTRGTHNLAVTVFADDPGGVLTHSEVFDESGEFVVERWDPSANSGAGAWVPGTETQREDKEHAYRMKAVTANDVHALRVKGKIKILIPGAGGRGAQPAFDVTVSHVDFDADTDNDSGGQNRPPSKNGSEDDKEYPEDSDAQVVGLLIGANDDHERDLDAGTWTKRDGGFSAAGDIDTDKDSGYLEARLQIAAKREGAASYPAVTTIGIYDEDGRSYHDENFEKEVPEDADATTHYNKSLYLEVPFYHQLTAKWSHRISFAPTGKKQGDDPADQISTWAIRTDLDVDTDNDGTVGNEGEDFDEIKPSTSGALMWGRNNNDTDGNGHPDNGEGAADWGGPDALTIQGEMDSDEMYPAVIRHVGHATVAEKAYLDAVGAQIILKKVGGPGKVRVFSSDGDLVLTAIDDGDSSSKVGNVDLIDKLMVVGSGFVEELDLLVEVLEPGEVELEVQFYLSSAAVVVHADRVRISAADIDIVLAKGLYKADGTYEAGYTSADAKGRVYINHEYVENAGAVEPKWKTEAQFVDFTAKVVPEGLTLPAGLKVVWTDEDPDDPTNNPGGTMHASHGKVVDPGDYDVTGAYNDAVGSDNTGARDGTKWEALPGFALAGSKSTIVAGKSSVRYNTHNDGGDNFIVKAALESANTTHSTGDKTGVFSAWKRLNVEYARMTGAPGIADVAGTLNGAYDLAFVEFHLGHSHEVPAQDPMGATDGIASHNTKQWVDDPAVFTHKGEKGWFFLGAAKRHLPPVGGGAPLYYDGAATLRADGVTFDLTAGNFSESPIHFKTGTKTATLPMAGGLRVMKTDITLVPDYVKGGLLRYDWDPTIGPIDPATGMPKGDYKERASIDTHTAGANAEITHTGDVDGANDRVLCFLLLPSHVYVHHTNGKNYSFPSRWGDDIAKAVEVWSHGYSSPFDIDALSFNVADHGFDNANIAKIQIRGRGGFSTIGYAPMVGRTVVFDNSPNPESTMCHEFGHAMGTAHRCGNWDCHSHDSTGTPCTMHYNYIWMLDAMLTDPVTGAPKPAPWSDKNKGLNFCGPHLRAIRGRNLEDNPPAEIEEVFGTLNW